MRNTCLSLALALLPLGSHAEIATYTFSANISDLEITHDFGLHYAPVSTSDMPGKTVSLGDLVTGQIVYDSSAPAGPSYPGADPNSRNYYDAIVSLNFQFQPSGLQFNGNSYSVIQVAKNPWGAALDGISLSARDNSRIWAPVGTLDFMNTDHSVLPSLDIPSRIALSDFPYAALTYDWGSDDASTHLQVYANIATLTPVSFVPEPGQWIMLATGALLLSATACRQRRNS